MKILFGIVELARGLARRESPRQFTLETIRATQVATALRASNAQAFDRGNAQNLVRFAVTRRHDDLECALKFALTHAAALAAAGPVLTFVLEDGPGTAELYLADAAVRTVRCSPTGLATDTEYEFVGGAITDDPPGSN
jgi:hypothetical protein